MRPITKNPNGTYTVPSFTNTNASYIVSQTPMGELFCNCPAYQFQHKESCKHVEAVTKFIKESQGVQNG